MTTLRVVLTSLLVCVVVALVSSFIIASWNISTSFDKTALVSSLVALNTSATLATFLTLFHSENKRIKVFREYPAASGAIYTIVILSTAIVCLMPGIVAIDQKIFNIGVDNIATTIAVALSTQVIIYLLLLIKLFVKE